MRFLLLILMTTVCAGCLKPPLPRIDSEHLQGQLVSEMPAGWKVRGPRTAVRPEALGVFTDYEIARSGTAGCILSVDATSDDWGTLMQSFNADEYRGKRVRFSAWVKTWRVDGWTGLWMGVDAESKEQIAYDDMEDRYIEGTTDWTRYSVVLDVDEFAAVVNIGVKLHGMGQVWIDDCTFEVVDRGVPVTDQFPLGIQRRYELPKTLFYEPLNLNFDEESL